MSYPVVNIFCNLSKNTMISKLQICIINYILHKQVSTTQNIYAHLLKESDKKASDAIANALYRNQA